MTILANLAVAGALSAQVTPSVQSREGVPTAIIAQANFVYGSGGTTVDAWLQTSLDDAASWCDVANFHFTTASARVLYAISALTVISGVFTPTDGAMAANTSVGGLVGPLWRVKYTIVGVYANSSLRIDLAGIGRFAPR